MKKEDIDTFLKVVETKSLLQASHLLYISQSTVSTRIKNLEDELNYPLFIRQKGIRQVVLTRQGELFLPIARNMQSLFQDALNMNAKEQSMQISMGATDYLNMHLLYPFYEYMMDRFDLHLTIKTYHSHETYQKIDEGLLDLGLVYNLYNYPGITAQKIFEEQIVLLAIKNHPYFQSQDLKDLEGYEEIFCSYSKDYEVWRNLHFNRPYKIRVGTLSNALQFLNPQRYLLIPDKLAQEFIKTHPDYDFCEFKQSYRRTLYLIQSQSLRKNCEDIDLFKEELMNYLL